MKSFTHRGVPERVDKLVASEIPSASRKSLKAACKDKKVLINGRPAKASDIVKDGDSIEVFVEFTEVIPEAAIWRSSRSPLAVTFEDEHLVIINKPRGVHSVRLREADPPTLADGLVALSSGFLEASPDKREAGLVQRLDFYTSGLIVAAKTREAWDALFSLLKEGGIEKKYQALVDAGKVKKGQKIGTTLAQSADGKKMEVSFEEADERRVFSAETEVERITPLPGTDLALATVSAYRAKRHQIRAHLASAGAPLVGDALYGSKKKLADYSAYKDGFLLVASSISFIHPFSGKSVSRDVSISVDELKH